MSEPDSIPEEQRDWEAEGDAHTLAKAEEIMRDPGRVMSAKKAANKLSDKKEKEAAAMNAVAGKQGDIEKAMKPRGAFLGAIPLDHYRR